jgi:hypothetical protein
MADEPTDKPNNNPNYKSRRVLADENAQLKEGLAKLMSRIDALEAKPSAAVDTGAIVAALKEDRDTTKSARLELELTEARKQLDAFKRPEAPTGYMPYTGYVMAKEDWWEKSLGYQCGPRNPQAKYPGQGDVCHIDTKEYWPGCPFVPVIVKETDPLTGRPIVAAHPDFASH